MTKRHWPEDMPDPEERPERHWTEFLDDDLHLLLGVVVRGEPGDADLIDGAEAHVQVLGDVVVGVARDEAQFVDKRGGGGRAAAARATKRPPLPTS